MRGELIEGTNLDRYSPVADLIEAEQVRPGNLFLRWDDENWTVGEFAAYARAAAAELQRRGIKPGDRVAILSGNSAMRVAWQFGVYWIGAVEVSINSELRGPMLQFVLEDSSPAVLLAETDLVEFVPESLGLPVVRSDEAIPPLVDASTARQLDTAQELFAPGDLGTILYTSGTTGPSKGVMLPRAYFSNLGAVFASVLDLDETDVGYLVLPFFHVDAHILAAACIQSGSALAFRRRFSVSQFWSDMERLDTSWMIAIGSILSALMTVRPPDESNHKLNRIMAAPVPPDAFDFFESELGIPITSLFGQTECDAVTFETLEDRRRGSAGKSCGGIDVEIRDGAGRSLPPGDIGQIVYRPQRANMVALGYWHRDDATVAAWKDLWFHSGDYGRLDEHGFLYFEGRLTDSLRRRGENISAWELERSIMEAPSVSECAAVGVLDDLGGEDEIKLFIVPSEGSDFNVEAFVAFCEEHLPRYAMPRFVELVQEAHFVRSAGSGVVQKHQLSRSTTDLQVIDLGTNKRATTGQGTR